MSRPLTGAAVWQTQWNTVSKVYRIFVHSPQKFSVGNFVFPTDFQHFSISIFQKLSYNSCQFESLSKFQLHTVPLSKHDNVCAVAFITCCRGWIVDRGRRDKWVAVVEPRQYESWHQLSGDILSDKPANLANSTKLVEVGADYFRDVGRHRQLTVEVNAKIANGFYWLDEYDNSAQERVGSESVSFSSICREPNQITVIQFWQRWAEDDVTRWRRTKTTLKSMTRQCHVTLLTGALTYACLLGVCIKMMINVTINDWRSSNGESRWKSTFSSNEML